MINLTELEWQEFFLRTLTLHWLTTLIVVMAVALMVTVMRRLNATTRHNIWLLTLISLAFMPLLVFAPRPELTLPEFQLTTTTGSESTSPVSIDGSDTLPSKPVSVTPDSSSLASAGTVAPGLSKGASLISLSVVLKAIFVFWLVGMLFLLRRLWGEYRAARELELQSDSVTPYFERRFDQLCARLGIDERPLLRFHAGISAPMTVGLFRVWVAIPMTWRETIDDSVFDQTLTHELGHIARKDPMTHTLQRMLSIVFWMYPAFWYVSRQLEIERESACDDWVLTHDGKGNTYATNLLDVAESLYLQPQVLAVGCLRSHSQLSRRIQNLLNKKSDHKLHNSWKLLALTSAGLMATMSVSAVAWPNARALTPPSLDANIDSVGAPPLPLFKSVGGEGTKRNDLPPLARASKPVAPIAPEAASIKESDGFEYKTSTTLQNEHGKLRIEGLGRGAVVTVEPKITAATPVLHAAWTGDVARLKQLASRDKNVLNTIHDRAHLPHTALEAAILGGHKKAVDKLIYLGVDLSPDTPANSQFKVGSPLTAAAMTGNYDIAKLLLNTDVYPDASTLLVAVENRDFRLVELFLKRNSCACFETDKALLSAIDNNDKKSIRLMMEYDVEVDRNALFKAVKTNNTKVVNQLLNNYDDRVDASLLTSAIRNRNSGIVSSLIKAGAELSESMVNQAVQQRDVNLVKVLIENDAPIEEAALMLAVEQRSAKMVQMLLESDAPVADGALVMALQNGDLSMAKNLLKNGVDVGSGSLVIAIQSQDVGLVRKLLDAGAPINDGALIIAAQSGNAEIIKLVRKYSDRSESELSNLLRSFDDKGQFNANYRASAADAGANAYSEAVRTNRNANQNNNENRNRNSSSNRNNQYERSSGKHGAGREPRQFFIAKWPVESSRISLGFDGTSDELDGYSKQHEALDFPMKEGSPVYAVAEGLVRKAGFSKGYGNYIVVEHADGYSTKYANNKKNKVRKGDYVGARQVIASVGSTASDSTRPHLHFEVHFEGEKLDPEQFFSSK
ncbi:MAG: ankyrin repeat domain-containing protein [Gammaproteobacteria bacterium]